MRTDIVKRRVAATVAEEAGDRITSALGQFATQHISSHVFIQPRRFGRMDIRHATIDDAEELRRIYNHEVETSTSTFDLVPRTVDEQRAWIREREGALGVLVAEVDGRIVGFSSLSPYRNRPAYNTTVENSVYVDAGARGLGVGKALLNETVAMAKARGFHTVIAHISDTEVAELPLAGTVVARPRVGARAAKGNGL